MVENFNTAFRSNERLPVSERMAQEVQQNERPGRQSPDVPPPGLQALEQMRAPQPPENPLSDQEKKQVDKIVGHVRAAEQGRVEGNFQNENQAHLDLAMDLSCMNPQDLEKMLPTINKAIEKDHLRLGQDGDDVWVGENRDGGQYYISYLAARQVNCGVV